MASSTGGWKSREELKQQKELEEARKAGTVAPLTDEDGNDISPHIPQYISQVPWYLQASGPTLKHQRLRGAESFDKTWYLRGVKKKTTATKYRKGACENCGALGHDAKSCLERPRKVNAKLSNSTISGDDVDVPDLHLSYDGARDRWNGYDPSDHQKVMERYQRIEAERAKLLEQDAKEKVKHDHHDETSPNTPTTTINNNNDSNSDSTSTSSNDDSTSNSHQQISNSTTQTTNQSTKETTNIPAAVQSLLYDDLEDEKVELDADVVLKGDEEQIGSKVNARTRTTIRNLRIREDTAKYLLNLDTNSAFYDPKTRSMRSNPQPWKHPDELDFAGENFVRRTGHAGEFETIQMYALEANEKGQPVHMEAAPSQLELVHREFREKKKILQNQERQQVLSKYGGEEHLKSLPKELLFGQTETFVEYSHDGQLKVDTLKKVVLSKWQENQFPSNHTSVWGSFWKDSHWGFACCHQMEKNSYCTGEAGKHASLMATKNALERQQRSSSHQIHDDNGHDGDSSKLREKSSQSSAIAAQIANSQSIAGQTEKQFQIPQLVAKKKENQPKLDPERLAKALARETKRQRGDGSVEENDRKRKYNSFAADSYEVTQEDMEAYRQKRVRHDDPMANFDPDSLN